jgi:hypothetical protein
MKLLNDSQQLLTTKTLCDYVVESIVKQKSPYFPIDVKPILNQLISHIKEAFEEKYIHRFITEFQTAIQNTIKYNQTEYTPVSYALLFETLMNPYFKVDNELSSLDPFFKVIFTFLDCYISFKPIDHYFLDLSHRFIKSLNFFPPSHSNTKIDLQAHRGLVKSKFKEISTVRNSLDNQRNIWFDEIDKSDNPAMTAMNLTFDFFEAIQLGSNLLQEDEKYSHWPQIFSPSNLLSLFPDHTLTFKSFFSHLFEEENNQEKNKVKLSLFEKITNIFHVQGQNVKSIFEELSKCHQDELIKTVYSSIHTGGMNQINPKQLIQLNKFDPLKFHNYLINEMEKEKYIHKNKFEFDSSYPTLDIPPIPSKNLLNIFDISFNNSEKITTENFTFMNWFLSRESSNISFFSLLTMKYLSTKNENYLVLLNKILSPLEFDSNNSDLFEKLLSSFKNCPRSPISVESWEEFISKNIFTYFRVSDKSHQISLFYSLFILPNNTINFRFACRIRVFHIYFSNFYERQNYFRSIRNKYPFPVSHIIIGEEEQNEVFKKQSEYFIYSFNEIIKYIFNKMISSYEEFQSIYGDYTSVNSIPSISLSLWNNDLLFDDIFSQIDVKIKD